MAVKIDIDSVAPILIEPEVVEEPEPKVVEDSKPKVEKSLIKTRVNLSVKPTMKLVPSLTAISLRSLDIYDPLQIFL